MDTGRVWNLQSLCWCHIQSIRKLELLIKAFTCMDIMPCRLHGSVFYYLQCYYELEIIRGQHGIGNYHLHSCFNGMFDDQSIPQIIAYSPEDIVRQIKGELVRDLSTTLVARILLNKAIARLHHKNQESENC